MIILGIESSCDDTSVALLDCSDKGCFVIDEKTASQIDIHKKYGGVVPELAGRAHAEKIVPLIEVILNNNKKPDAIAVTAGPGLITGLLVGVEAARTLSYVWDVPLVGVNHIEGHVHSVQISNSQFPISNQFSNLNVKNKNVMLNSFQYLSNKKQSSAKKILKQVQNDNTNASNTSNISNNSNNSNTSNITYPALALIASGGHTELIYIPKQGQYKKIGATKDDAAGECFDKVAKLLGLPYPGGPQISKLAEKGNPEAIKFPRPMINDKTYYFSFSGLKTSALYWLRDNVIASEERASQSHSSNMSLRGVTKERRRNPVQEKITSNPRDSDASPPTGGFARNDISINDFCASFQQAIIDVLVTKTIRAAQKYQPKTIILGGGVSANKQLRGVLEKEIQQNFPHSSFLIPHSSYSMDNATMIAVAGYYKAMRGEFTNWKKIKADPNWEL